MPPRRSAAGTSRPLSGPIRTSPRRDADRDRPARRADAGVDDRDVEPDRQVRQRAPQRERPVADRVLADLVGEVDDLGVGADAEHDRPADRRGRVAQAEVGEQRDDRSGHGRGMVAGELQQTPKRRREEDGVASAVMESDAAGRRERDRRARRGVRLRALHRRCSGLTMGVGRPAASMTRQSQWTGYLRRCASVDSAPCAYGRSSCGSWRLVLAALWFVAFALVLLGYRPGGPVDLLVGLAAAGPILSPSWPSPGRRSRAATARSRPSPGWRSPRSCCCPVDRRPRHPARRAAGRRRCSLVRGRLPVAPRARRDRPVRRAWARPAAARRGALAPATRLAVGRAGRRGLVLATGTAVQRGRASSTSSPLGDRPAIASRFGPDGSDARAPAVHGALTAGATARARPAAGRLGGRPADRPGGHRAGSATARDFALDGVRGDTPAGRPGRARRASAGEAWMRRPGHRVDGDAARGRRGPRPRRAARRRGAHARQPLRRRGPRPGRSSRARAPATAG